MVGRDRGPSFAPWVANALAVIITLVWAVVYGATVFADSEYKPPVEVNLAFLGVLGAVFGINIAGQVGKALGGIRIVRDDEADGEPPVIQPPAEERP